MTNDQKSARPQSPTSQRAPLRRRACATLTLRIASVLAAVLAVPAGASAQAAASTASQDVQISRRAARPAQPAPASHFTGAVRLTPLFDATPTSRVSGGSVSFEPGARSAWHAHPLGQTLIVTAGTGRVQRWGGPVEVIREGDVVWTPPGVKHWHGAAPTTAMTHIAVQEALDGKAVAWLEHVTEEQYNGKSGTR